MLRFCLQLGYSLPILIQSLGPTEGMLYTSTYYKLGSDVLEHLPLLMLGDVLLVLLRPQLSARLPELVHFSVVRVLSSQPLALFHEPLRVQLVQAGLNLSLLRAELQLASPQVSVFVSVREQMLVDLSQVLLVIGNRISDSLSDRLEGGTDG